MPPWQMRPAVLEIGSRAAPAITQCCIGVFAINQLDAARLTQGFRKLKSLAPDRAAAVHQRARDAMSRLSASFPGDPVTGILADGEEFRRFEDFANDEPCPLSMRKPDCANSTIPVP